MELPVGLQMDRERGESVLVDVGAPEPTRGEKEARAKLAEAEKALEGLQMELAAARRVNEKQRSKLRQAEALRELVLKQGAFLTKHQVFIYYCCYYHG